MPYTILATVIFLFIVIFILMPLHFSIRYQRKETDDCFIIDTTALGKIIRYRLTIPVAELTSRTKLPWIKSEIESRAGETESQTVKEQEKTRAWLMLAVKQPREVHAKIYQVLDLVHDYSDFMRWITRKIRFERFHWVTRIGLMDAPETAIAAGMCWAVQSYIATTLWHKHYHVTSRPQLKVIPMYNQDLFQVDFECIFNVRLGHIIYAGIRLLKYKI